MLGRTHAWEIMPAEEQKSKLVMTVGKFIPCSAVKLSLNVKLLANPNLIVLPSAMGTKLANMLKAMTYQMIRGANGDKQCQNYYTYVPPSDPSDPPTAAPSFKPSSQPSESPSSQPSESPSSQPSASPSDQPSGMPSESPSSMPSSQPSGTPSCTPSSAPTPSPSINLFYPDQSKSGKCLNDGGQPAWMEANPQPGFLPRSKNVAHSMPLGMRKYASAAILKSVPRHCGIPIGRELTRGVFVTAMSLCTWCKTHPTLSSAIRLAAVLNITRGMRQVVWGALEAQVFLMELLRPLLVRSTMPIGLLTGPARMMVQLLST
eukprot:scaffold25770_cov31-Cyclotella_meneghiniana.AAC.2